MDNLMGQNIEEATRMYDLKGSTFQRIVMNPRSGLQTRKDLNYIEDADYRMLVNKKIQKDLLNRMHKDKEFLKSCDLMDYSLLLVFFKKTKIESHSPQNWQGSTPPQNFGELSTKNRKMSIFIKYTNEGKFLCVEEQDKSGDNLLNSPDEKNHPFMRTQSMNFPNLQIKNDPFSANKFYSIAIDDQEQIGTQQLKPPNFHQRKVSQDPTIKRPTFSRAFTLGRQQSDSKSFYQKFLPSNLIAQNKPIQNADDYIQYQSEFDQDTYYRIGIIDFLQKYNRAKKVETKWLKLRNRNVDPSTFSCVPPKLYGDRFLNYMKTHLFSERVTIRESDFQVRQTEMNIFK